MSFGVTSATRIGLSAGFQSSATAVETIETWLWRAVRETLVMDANTRFPAGPWGVESRIDPAKDDLNIEAAAPKSDEPLEGRYFAANARAVRQDERCRQIGSND